MEERNDDSDWYYETFVQNSQVYHQLFRKCNNQPSSRNRTTLNKLLLECEKNMSDEEYHQMVERLGAHEQRIYGTIQKTDPAKTYSRSLQFRNEPERTKFRESEHRLRSLRKAQAGFQIDILSSVSVF